MKTFILSFHISKNIKTEKNNDTELLKTNKGNVDPFDYHVSNCGKYSFENYEYTKLV